MKHPLYKGIVLAGGMSRRFGSDKALAVFEGDTFLGKSVSLLQKAGLEAVIITRQERNYAFTGCRIETDEVPDLGPLGGLYTACGLFPEQTFVVLTCDMPLLTSAVIQDLLSAHKTGTLATVFALERDLQPFPGVYSAALRRPLGKALAEKKLSVQAFLRSLSGALETLPISDNRAFSNLNEKK